MQGSSHYFGGRREYIISPQPKGRVKGNVRYLTRGLGEGRWSKGRAWGDIQKGKKCPSWAKQEE